MPAAAELIAAKSGRGDVDHCLGEGGWRFLRKVVPDAPAYDAMLVFA